MAKQQASAAPSAATSPSKRPDCGVVMPISSADGLTEQHWLDVRSILFDAIETAGFDPKLVSDSADVRMIHKNIVENLYANEMIVCDVSARTPNVMTELGMRLAFDKPIIIVKDRTTDFSFDTHPIPHLLYPRDLRYAEMVTFKTELAKKIKATHAAAYADPDDSPFLGPLGPLTVAKKDLDVREVTGIDALREELSDIRRSIERLGRTQTVTSSRRVGSQPPNAGPRLTRDAEQSVRSVIARMESEGFDVSSPDGFDLLMTTLLEMFPVWKTFGRQEMDDIVRQYLH